MQYTRLGRTGLQVSRLCLGTMNFGPQTPEADSYAIMDHALELGINFWDTADVYGWKQGEGVTEQILGRYFAQGGNRREKVVLATKVYGNMGFGDMKDYPNEKGLSAKHIRHACDASLKRMQTDYIDLYQMHHIDRTAPWEEIFQAFEVLVQQGKVLYFGSSNFAGWHIAKAGEIAKMRGFMGLVAEQSLYNLNARTIELEVLPACEDYGLGRYPVVAACRGISGRRASKSHRRTPSGYGKTSGSQPGKTGKMGRLVRRTGRKARRCRAGVASQQQSRDRAHYRPAHNGAVGRQSSRP